MVSDSYIKATLNSRPRPLLLEALSYCDNKEKALDLGAGALNESKYLLSQGFLVTAVDSKKSLKELAEPLKPQLTFIASTFDKYEFPQNEFDLVCAFYSLPFNTKDTFEAVFAELVKSLRPNGVFVGQFFGEEDDWSKGPNPLTFHNREQIESLLRDFEIIKIDEEKATKPTASGKDKNWHTFHVIAKKIKTLA